MDPNRLLIKPSLFQRLLGLKLTKFSVVKPNNSIEISAANKELVRKHLHTWDFVEGWISCRLLLIAENRSAIDEYRIPKNAKHDVERFLFHARYGDELLPFCEALALCSNGENYFSFSILTELKSAYTELLTALHSIGLAARESAPAPYRRTLDMFLDDEQQFRAQYNDWFISSESEKWSALFQNLESNPLTGKQIESVVSEEDATLVVAGAGTGKTSSVVGKIGYLLSANRANSENILALAFNRDAAAEMRERVRSKTGHTVEIRTFHAYGKTLIENQSDERIKIADFEQFERAKLAHVNSILSAMYDDGEESSLIVSFLSFHRYPAKFREDFDTQKDYLRYMAKMEPVTLNEEWVKSFEEVLIADWLTIHGINYEYEKPYEHKTSTRVRRQYQPDFYLTDYGIYLEHFGIGRNGKTAPWMNQAEYNRGIKWKRELHRQHKTKLIETYSWERMEGVLSSNLKKKLEKAGVVVSRVSSEDLRAKFEQKRVNEKLVSLIKDFLSVFKEGLWETEEIWSKIEKQDVGESRRFTAFMKIFVAFFRRYQGHLERRGEIDFADLIVLATKAIKHGKARPKFTHIIVDEFQDISRGRGAFLQAIRESSNNCKLMCVGDDWQSIYGFTGSDVRMTTQFKEHFGAFRRVDLDRTFRFRQPIIDASSRFIQENPAQLEKNIAGREPLETLDIVVRDGDELKLENDITALLEEISQQKNGKSASVLFLGRYNFTKPDFFDAVAKKFGNLRITFMTIHKSKGLEADYVVILGLSHAKFGFPGSIANDPIMNLVRPAEEEFEDAEERRVFYVALTRAREKVFLLKPSSPSRFLTSLMEYPEVDVSSVAGSIDKTCPECSSGQLSLKFPNRLNGYAWHCSFGRYCGGKAKFCQRCHQYPEVNGQCADKTCKPINPPRKSRKKRR